VQVLDRPIEFEAGLNGVGTDQADMSHKVTKRLEEWNGNELELSISSEPGGCRLEMEINIHSEKFCRNNS
jgi:hypothetical protein